MDIPQIGTPIGSLIIVCCLWAWTIRKGKAHVFRQNILIKEQNNLTSWAFASCAALTVLSFKVSLSNTLISVLSFLIFIVFAVLENRNSEGFWKKKRNILAAGIMTAIGFFVAPYGLTEQYFVPLLCSFLIAHVAHKRFMEIFSNNLKDLQALQAKLLKQDSDRRNKSIIASNGSNFDYNERIETTA